MKKNMRSVPLIIPFTAKITDNSHDKKRYYHATHKITPPVYITVKRYIN